MTSIIPLYDTDTPVTPAQLTEGQVIYRRVALTTSHLRVWVPCHPRQAVLLDKRDLPSGPRGATVLCRVCGRVFDLSLVITGPESWVAWWKVRGMALVTSSIGRAQPMSEEEQEEW